MRISWLIVLCLVVAGCGSGGSVTDDDIGGENPAATVGSDEAGSGTDDECRHGMAGMCADALASELASLPLHPSTDEFSLSNGGPDDTRGSVRQNVFFTDGPEAVADFYEAELDAAGFEITSVEGTAEDRTIWFTTADGMNGRLHVRSAVDPHAAQMNIELCVADACVF